MADTAQRLTEAATHHEAGRWDQAEAIYRSELEVDPHNSDALHLLGLIAHQHGRHDEAIRLIQSALSHDDSHWALHSNLAVSLQAASRFEAAIDAYRRAIELAPPRAFLHSNLGTLYQDQKRFDQAEQCYRQALELDPRHAEAHYNLGNLFIERDEPQQAIPCYEQALRIAPNYADAHVNLANLLTQQGKLNEAVHNYRWALDVEPRRIDALYNLARTLKLLRNDREALETYERVLALAPQHEKSHVGRADLLLRAGRFTEGWHEYHWRHQAWQRAPLRQSPPANWQGESLDGRRILVYPEQGLGDEIMFATCLPDVLNLADGVIVECDPRLVPLYRRSFPTAEIRAVCASILEGTLQTDSASRSDGSAAANDLSPANPNAAATANTTAFGNQGGLDRAAAAVMSSPVDLDYQVPIGSLPRWLRPQAAAFPRQDTLLKADASEVELARRVMSTWGPGAKVGISWRGFSDQEEVHRRSTALEQWAPVLRQPGFHWVSLQFGPVEEEITRVQRQWGITLHQPDGVDLTNDLDALAAQMSALDLIITVGNTTSHLAGAIGAETWTLLSSRASWRWHERGEESLWYGNMRLLRQAPDEDLSALFERAGRRLSARFHSQHITRFTAEPESRIEAGLDSKFAVKQSHAAGQQPAPGWKRTPVSSNENAPLSASNASRPTPALGTITDSRWELDQATPAEALVRAIHYHQHDDRHRAEGLYREILRLDPRHSEVWHRLGVLSRETGRNEQSIEYIQRALELKPDNALAHFHLSSAQGLNKRREDAIESLKRCLELNPDFPEAYLNLGAHLEQLGRLDEAYSYCERAAELMPRSHKALYNLANILLHRGDVKRAAALYERVLHLRPDFPRAHWNYGLAHLLQGNWAVGWSGYAWRQLAEQVKIDAFPYRIWNGDSLRDKTILIHAEQGIGDEIMFGTCFDEVISQAKRSVLTCDPRLVPLFQRSFPSAEVHGVLRKDDRRWQPPPGIDVTISAGSLPYLLRSSWDSFPRQPRHLVADPRRVSTWRERFSRLGAGLNIGISWRAGGISHEQRRRIASLEHWAPILNLPGANFINLQYGDCQADLAAARDQWGFTIHDFEDANPLEDLDGAAAQIAALDLVVSVGNTTIHMAGGLGVETLVLLPHIPGWRYLLGIDEMPWYGTVRLFRQPSVGDWHGVIASIAEIVRQKIAAGRPPVVEAHSTPAPTVASAAPPTSGLTRMSAPPPASALTPTLPPTPGSNSQDKPSPATPSDPTADAADSSDITVESKLATALHQHRAGNLAQADALYGEVLAVLPDSADALHLRGVVRHQMGQGSDAVQWIRQAIQLRSDEARFHHNLGNILNDLGRIDEAIDAFLATLKRDPSHFEAAMNLGVMLKLRHRDEQALEVFRYAESLQPDHAQVKFIVAELLDRLGRPDEAIESYQAAIRLEPLRAELYFNLGNLLRRCDRLPEARDSYEAALRLRPGYGKAATNLGIVLREMRQFQLSVEAHRHAIAASEADPRTTAGQFARGHANLGGALMEQGRSAEAIESFQRALDYQADYAEAHMNKALAHLVRGEFEPGWAHYEWRWLLDSTEYRPHYRVGHPLWDGQPLHDKTLLVHAEQGVGDEIMFASCVDQLIDQAGHVVLDCDPRLVPLFARSFPRATVRGTKWADVDAMRRLVEEHGVHLQVASGGVPRFLRRSESDFPHRRGFLSASEERIAQWRDRLAGLGRQPKVGISWIGGGDPTERRRRSLPLLQWRQLLQRRDVQFVNLQYGDCEEQLRQAEQQLGVRIHSFADVDPLKELDNFAALVRSLDLVISVTNATVHLAGSLGVAVLALIPGVAPWRWLEQRGDSPWYGSVQLVRRGTEESEAHLLHRVSRQLDESLGTRTILHDAARKNMPPATAFSLAENWIRSTRNADGPLGP